jgi:hypothetical protein
MHRAIQLVLIIVVLFISGCADVPYSTAKNDTYSTSIPREYCTQMIVDTKSKHTCIETNLRKDLPVGSRWDSQPRNSQETRAARQKELAAQQKTRIKQTCLEFGFSEGTTEFSSCQLDLYKTELAASQNTKMLETIDKNAAAERAQVQKVADEQEARRHSKALGAALLGISKSLLTPPPQPERYDTDCTTYGNDTDCTTTRR